MFSCQRRVSIRAEPLAISIEIVIRRPSERGRALTNKSTSKTPAWSIQRRIVRLVIE